MRTLGDAVEDGAGEVVGIGFEMLDGTDVFEDELFVLVADVEAADATPFICVFGLWVPLMCCIPLSAGIEATRCVNITARRKLKGEITHREWHVF